MIMFRAAVFVSLILASASKPSHVKKVNVHYNIWVGNDVNKSYSIKIKADNGTKFFNVMEAAAAVDNRFRFTYQNFSIGRFITSIGGVNQTSTLFWMIYVLKSHPNTYNKPGSDKLSQVGVDEIEVTNGKHYLFWLNSGNH